MNSTSKALAQELDLSLRHAEKDDGIRVLVLSGKGKVFCAGADLREAALRHEILHLREHMRSYVVMEVLKAFSENRKPRFKGCWEAYRIPRGANTDYA